MKTRIPFVVLILLFGYGQVASQAYRKAIDQEAFNGNFKTFAEQVNMFYDTATGSNRGGYKQWKRAEWFAMHHMNEKGGLVDYVAKNTTAISEVQQWEHASTSRMPVTGSWSNVGYASLPGAEAMQGRVNSVAFDPVNSNIIYVATTGGGIWKSFNNGDSWDNLTTDLPILSISDIVICPAPNNHILYALTGDLTDQPNVYAHISFGVYKSFDSGVTWTRTGLSFPDWAGTIGYKLLMHPANQDELLASTTNGVYRTTNGGLTWTLIFSPGFINDMEFKPNNADTLYLTARGDNRLFKLRITNNVWISTQVTTAAVDRMEIGVTPHNPNAVYVLAGPGFLLPNDNTNYFRGLYYYGNSGGPFIQRATTCDNNGDLFRSSRNQSFYDNTIWVDPFDQNHILAGGVNFFGSTNGGTNLTQITATAIHPDLHNLQRNPLNGDLWLCSDGGVYRSTDNGVTWNNRSNGLIINEFYRISGTGDAIDVILGGTQDNGHVLRNEQGDFVPVMTGDGMDNYINSTNHMIAYACSQNGGLRRSINGGLSFLVTALPNAGSGAFFPWITPIVQHPPTYDPENNSWINPDVIYAYSFASIWRSDDGFNFVPLPNLAPGQSNALNPSMAIAQDGVGVRLYVSNGVSLWYCDNPLDVNTTWTTVTLPNLNNQFVSGMTVNTANREEIWIVVSGYSLDTKVFRSLNSGATWNNHSLSLPNVPIYSITFANALNDPPGAIYIGSEIGVFYKDDNLLDWIPFSNSLPHVPVTDLFPNFTTGELKAATYGRGIWESPLYETCGSTVLVDFEINQGQYHFESSDLLYAYHTITGGIGARVTMKAANQVRLLNNFRADRDTYVRIGIGNCGSGILGQATIPAVIPVIESVKEETHSPSNDK